MKKIILTLLVVGISISSYSLLHANNKTDTKKEQGKFQNKKEKISKENKKPKSETSQAKKQEKTKARDSKIKKLENKRRELALKIYKLRQKLISEDSELQTLHESAMDLHKKIAHKLRKKPEMKQLLKKAGSIDDKILKLIKQQKDNTDTEK